MNLLDEIEGSDGLAEEEKDFLKSLEKMAEEIDAEKSNQWLVGSNRKLVSSVGRKQKAGRH